MSDKNYIDQLKETWAKSGLDAEMMMESMIQQWKAMGMDPETMLAQMQNIPAADNTAQPAHSELADSLLSESDEDDEDLNPFSKWDEDKLYFNPDSTADLTLLKAINCGSVLSVINNSYLNSVKTGLTKDQALQVLSQHWGIDDINGFNDIIDWLLSHGHRRIADPIWVQISKHPHSNWEDIADKILIALNFDEDDIDTAAEFLENIIDGYPLFSEYLQIKHKSQLSTLAWDFCRAINLFRWAVDAEFITEYEAKQNIISISNRLLSHYKSWENLSASYVLGMTMWNSGYYMMIDALHAHYQLMTDSQSPWQLIDWK